MWINYPIRITVIYQVHNLNHAEWLSSTRLVIAARPFLSLTEHATVLNGEKTTLSCKITGFYPELVVVRWVQKAGHQNLSVADVCSSSPILNPDYTYNLTSHMSIQGDHTVNHGAVYICQIEHRSFDKPQSRTVRLSVMGKCPRYMMVLFDGSYIDFNNKRRELQRAFETVLFSVTTSLRMKTYREWYNH